jgi:Ras-related protein Rab-8A
MILLAGSAALPEQDEEVQWTGQTWTARVWRTLAPAVHIKAPGGSGKTFLGIHCALQCLNTRWESEVRSSHLSGNTTSADGSTLEDGVVIWAARNQSLGTFVVKWILRRLSGVNEEADDTLLSRLLLLFEPFSEGLRRVKIRNRKIETEPLAASLPVDRIAALVIDEAHHVHESGQLKGIVEQYRGSGTRLVLLSDVSQSKLGSEMDKLFDSTEVKLSQVVRCSRRIVLGAAMFGASGENPDCEHAADGLPLDVVLFDLPAATGSDAFYRIYAEKAADAFGEIQLRFSDLSFDDRILFIVPTMEFKRGIEKDLKKNLQLRMSKKNPNRRCALINADEASATLGRKEGEERLILDCIEHCDGLERLFAIVVGMDQRSGGTPGVGATYLDPRSYLYRGISRAQLQPYVVNEALERGWLEFVIRLRFMKDEQLDYDDQRGQIDPGAARNAEQVAHVEATKEEGREATEEIEEEKATDIEELAPAPESKLDADATPEARLKAEEEARLKAEADNRTILEQARQDLEVRVEAASSDPENIPNTIGVVNDSYAWLSSVPPESGNPNFSDSVKRLKLVLEHQLVAKLDEALQSTDLEALEYCIRLADTLHDFEQEELLRRARVLATCLRLQTRIDALAAEDIEEVIPVVKHGLSHLRQADFELLLGLDDKFQQLKQGLEKRLAVQLDEAIEGLNLMTLREALRVAEEAHDFPDKQAKLERGRNFRALLELDSKLDSVAGEPEDLERIIPTVKSGLSTMQKDGWKDIPGLGSKFQAQIADLERKLIEKIDEAINKQDITDLDHAVHLVASAHEFDGRPDKLNQARALRAFLHLNEELDALASNPEDLARTIPIVNYGLSQNLRAEDLQMVPGLERFERIKLDLEQRLTARLEQAISDRDADILETTMSSASSAHDFAGKLELLKSAEVTARDVRLEAVLKDALATQDVEILIDSFMREVKEVPNDDKSSQVRSLEAEVKQVLEASVLDELSAAIESQVERQVNRALRLAERVHDFEGKALKMQEAEQIMKLRPQLIWNTTQIQTRLGGGKPAFDPLKKEMTQLQPAELDDAITKGANLVQEVKEELEKDSNGAAALLLRHSQWARVSGTSNSASTSSTSRWSVSSKPRSQPEPQSKKRPYMFIKLLMIGDSVVRQSALLLRFTDDPFSPTFITTRDVGFKTKDMQIDGKHIKVQIWDTNELARFPELETTYYRGAHGILLIYDVTNSSSFQNISNWYHEIQKHAAANMKFLLIGESSREDKEARAVSTEEGQELAREYGMQFFEANCRENINVTEAFTAITREVKEELEKDDSNSPRSKPRNTTAAARRRGLFF